MEIKLTNNTESNRNLSAEEIHHKNELMMLTDALSTEYTTVILVDMDNDRLSFKKTDPNVNASKLLASELPTYSAFANMYTKVFVQPEYKDEMYEKMALQHMRQYFAEQGRGRYSIRYKVFPNSVGQVNFNLKVVAINDNGHHYAVLGARCIDGLVRNEERDKKVLSDALAAAEHSNKAKSVFLNNMSHDIRTPMNAIIGFTELAKNHIDEKEKVSAYLSKISLSSHYLLSLINQVLDMSRIESGSVLLNEDAMSITDMLHDICSIIEGNAETKGQRLCVNTHSVVHDAIVTDKMRLSQVFVNILGNAVKYTPEGGTIQFSIFEYPGSRDDRAVYEYHIKDNGIGMSDDFQKYVFESFSREDTATVSGIQGTGLGMAITKKIVDLMGGTISVYSKKGVGTEFTVRIECRISEAIKSDSHAMTSDISFDGKHILLVEDNKLNQEIAQTLLEEIGLDVKIAANGKLAVDYVRNTPAEDIDVILMDVQMPVMDGYEATKQIRALKDRKKAAIPIVAMTANAFEEDRQLGMEAGMNGFLAKPIDIPVVLQELSKFLR